MEQADTKIRPDILEHRRNFAYLEGRQDTGTQKYTDKSPGGFYGIT